MKITHEDELALHQLLSRYTHLLDYKEVDRMGEIWTEDCLFQVDQPDIRIEGVKNLQEMFRGTGVSHPQVRHVVSNIYVEQKGDTVLMHSYLQILDTQQMAVTMFARYRDRCVKTAQGWRIAERWCLNG